MAMQPFYLGLMDIFMFRPRSYIFDIFQKYSYSMFQFEINYNDKTHRDFVLVLVVVVKY